MQWQDVGDYRKGEVVKVNDDGSVDVEWSDGTTTTLQLRRVKGKPGRLAPCGNPQCPCNLMGD